MPKTAGSSFLASLEEYYAEGLVRDYDDIPINTPVFKRNAHALKMCIANGINPPKNIECIHGHFLPVKFFFCKKAKFVTWMRDPVERVASHYFYWLRNYDPQNCPRLHQRVIDEGWSLERFCLSPELRNLYSQFLWRFPLGRFDFVGITEHYETELGYFSGKLLGARVQSHRENINPREKISYFEDNVLKKKVEQYHSKDVSLYNHALKIRLLSRSS